MPAFTPSTIYIHINKETTRAILYEKILGILVMIVSVKLGDPFGNFSLCNLKRITLTLTKLGHFKVL